MTKRNVLLTALLLSAIIFGVVSVSRPDSAVMRADGSLAPQERSAAAPGFVSGPQKKIRILLVPGHEPRTGGTYFHDVYERDLNVRLSQDLRDHLQDDGRYEVLMTRDTRGWNPLFGTYFDDHRDDIIAWRDATRSKVADLLRSGAMQKLEGEVDHKKVDEDVSVVLHGINKWANENAVDVTLHVHFNEHRKNGFKKPGIYSGFTIYVPSPEYGNGASTRVIAKKIFGRLSTYDPVSDFPGETDGVVDEPDLIAIGPRDTARAPSLLVEYGYIYEERFTDPALRDVTLRDLAHQTYAGLRDAFGQDHVMSDPFGTAVLPRTWQTAVTEKSSPSDIYALQTALAVDGVFPPKGMSKHDCPRDGTLRSCTVTALAAFQLRHGIEGETGYAGTKTLEKLNELFSETPKWGIEKEVGANENTRDY